MTHKREDIIVALATKVAAFPALSGAQVDHDRLYQVEIDVDQAITVNQGADSTIQYLAKYIDSELEFAVLLQARVNEDVRPATLLNALAANVIKALTPYADGSAGIAGASNLTEIGTTAIEISDLGGERPTAYMTLNMTIQYRRDADDPENLTP